MLPSKIASETNFLIPIENNQYIYERYNYFKYNYWLVYSDTLYHKDSTALTGGVLIKLNNYSTELNLCDSSVNNIRNSALDFKTHREIQDSAKKYIGLDNTEFFNGINNNSPSETDKYISCHNDYKNLTVRWKNHQLLRIDSISKNQLTRYYSFQKADINKDSIASFLSNYSNCETDFKTLCTIIEREPSKFIKSVEISPDSELWKLEWFMKNFSSNIDTKNALEAIISTEYKSHIKNRLKRKLKTRNNTG